MKTTALDIIVAGTAAIIAKKSYIFLRLFRVFFFNFRTVVETLEM